MVDGVATLRTIEHHAAPGPTTTPVPWPRVPCGRPPSAARRRSRAPTPRTGRRWTLLANRVGYVLLAVAVVVFFIAFAIGFTRRWPRIVVGTLIVGSVLLAPSIVLGYAVKAAERDDRERQLVTAAGTTRRLPSGSYAPSPLRHRPPRAAARRRPRGVRRRRLPRHVDERRRRRGGRHQARAVPALRVQAGALPGAARRGRGPARHRHLRHRRRRERQPAHRARVSRLLPLGRRRPRRVPAAVRRQLAGRPRVRRSGPPGDAPGGRGHRPADRRRHRRRAPAHPGPRARRPGRGRQPSPRRARRAVRRRRGRRPGQRPRLGRSARVHPRHG